MGLGQAAIGIGATLLSKFLALKSWTLENAATKERIQGQFPAEELTRSTGANWTEISALNRQHPFLQYLSGKTDTMSVASRFYRKDLFDDAPVTKIEKLIAWSRALPSDRRPPLLTFYLGDGLGLQMDVVLTAITDIKYSIPNSLGGIRQVQFVMEFSRWSKEALNQADIEVTDTRYAHIKDGEYYELLCEREYGDPMAGVIIRQRHPTQAILKTGDIIPLPALEGIRGITPTQQSIPLKTAFGRKDTAQKRLRIQFFNLRSLSAPSSLFVPPQR